MCYVVGMDESKKIKFTGKVRRGLGQMLARHLEERIELAIANCTRPGLPRNMRMLSTEVGELRAAVAWLKQEALRADSVPHDDVASDAPSGEAAETTPREVAVG